MNGQEKNREIDGERIQGNEKNRDKWREKKKVKRQT